MTKLITKLLPFKPFLVGVVVAFIICYSPFHVQRIMAINIDEKSSQFVIDIYSIINHISGVTYYLSSTLNPILYQVLSRKYRQAFNDTICCVRNSNHYQQRRIGNRLSRETTLNTISGTTNNSLISYKSNTRKKLDSRSKSQSIESFNSNKF